MAEKPNKNFDPQWYLTAYPDVSLSGIAPEEHYERFGRLLGRMPNGDGPHAAVFEQMAGGSSSLTVDQQVWTLPTIDPTTDFASGDAAEAIIERPAGLDLSTLVAKPAPDLPGISLGEAVPLSFLSDLISNDPGDGDDAQRLNAYRRMLSLDPAPPATGETGFEGLQCAPPVLINGEIRIDNAWVVNGSDGMLLRLAIQGKAPFSTLPEDWNLRAWQASPERLDMIQQAGAGVALPACGPLFHDIALVHPFMPVILQLSDAEGDVRAIGLLPFPSLLPGGVHAAELKALQSLPDPMASFWSLSDAFLLELLGAPGLPLRSINRLSLRRPDAGQQDSPVSILMLGWLPAVFGFRAEPETDGRGTTLFSEAAAIDGLSLHLAGDSIPTLAALVSRRLHQWTGNQKSGSFLISEYPDLRPRWSVSLPATDDAQMRAPALVPANNGDGDETLASIPIHLSIALRPPATPARSSTDNSDKPRSLPPLTIVIDAHDAERTEALLQGLLQWNVLLNAEIMARLTGDEAKLRPVMDAVCGEGQWNEVPIDEDLRSLANKAHQQWILSISDEVDPESNAPLASLFAMLDAAPRAASASCLLLGQKIFKKTRVIQPASGGLFPARISFICSPRLGFAEPDVSQALAGLDYPVIANSWTFSLWRTQALSSLPAHPALPHSARDIALGLDLLTNNWRNLCTTRTSIDLHGAGERRDTIDPIGSTYIQPGDWEDILRQVTVVRELFS